MHPATRNALGHLPGARVIEVLVGNRPNDREPAEILLELDDATMVRVRAVAGAGLYDLGAVLALDVLDVVDGTWRKVNGQPVHFIGNVPMPAVREPGLITRHLAPVRRHLRRLTH